jgi:pyruvate,water dikinase
VRNLEEADKVERGDILVCRTTSPAWTPLFSRVAGVVADSGGILSHCAIVAREFAIPCVVGVREGSKRIRDGMLITVDGGQGTVRLED